ncbi:MAG: CapA family protein [Bernardetiaceae bacterium]|nr:CapA family protein [Bernardetiaceae bacterium]
MMHKIIAPSRLLYILLVFFFLSCNATEGQTPYPSEWQPKEKTELKAQKISIAFVGDLMCHSPQFKYAQKADGTYDFEPVYEPIKEFLSSADFAVGNLETILAGKSTNYSGYPQFNTPNSYADALKAVGFDLIVTANNHSYDQGEAGLVRTLDELHKRKIPTEGTYRNQVARDSVHVYTRNGIRFAILAYTQFSNIPVPSEKRYWLNHIDTILIKQDIQKARKLGAEIVILHVHWGSEYKQEPTAYQVDMGNQLMGLGPDIIIGGHPHALQPVKRFKTAEGASLDSGLIAYSLGNFYSNQQWRYSDAGVILKLNIEKKGDKIRLLQSEALPTWVFKGSIGSERAYRILPSGLSAQDKLPYWLYKDYEQHKTYLQPIHWQKMAQAHTDSEYTLQRYDSPALRIVAWKSPPRILQFNDLAWKAYPWRYQLPIVATPLLQEHFEYDPFDYKAIKRYLKKNK